MKTARDVTYQLPHEFSLTTNIRRRRLDQGNLSEELPFRLPLYAPLQEASVIAIADVYAQSTRRPALVNPHAGVGLGNASAI